MGSGLEQLLARPGLWPPLCPGLGQPLLLPHGGAPSLPAPCVKRSTWSSLLGALGRTRGLSLGHRELLSTLVEPPERGPEAMAARLGLGLGRAVTPGASPRALRLRAIHVLTGAAAVLGSRCGLVTRHPASGDGPHPRHGPRHPGPHCLIVCQTPPRSLSFGRKPTLDSPAQTGHWRGPREGAHQLTPRTLPLDDPSFQRRGGGRCQGSTALWHVTPLTRSAALGVAAGASAGLCGPVSVVSSVWNG